MLNYTKNCLVSQYVWNAPKNLENLYNNKYMFDFSSDI